MIIDTWIVTRLARAWSEVRRCTFRSLHAHAERERAVVHHRKKEFQCIEAGVVAGVLRRFCVWVLGYLSYSAGSMVYHFSPLPYGRACGLVVVAPRVGW